MSEQKTIYASVDLELTGFDPATDEIVEIGIVLFELRQGLIVVLQEWQTLVKPKGSLHTRIQGLTGITEQALESAPTKDMVFSKVAALLENTVLVGHGVSLDRRFLEAFGLAQSSATVDTLELAQIFLPTYHSYNLEN
ncbi:MAG: 3'-5' exonuclease, partial [Candidatus Doudnabacteria bacterium]|nr:3'-5' exonuclease [Candidatus Doudnabacteria bacterium]